LPLVTLVSAPPARVTVLQEPKLPQVPAERLAEARSTTPLVESMPDSESEPFESVSATDALVYQGPPERAAVGPVGAVTSLVTVKVAVAVPLAPLVAVTVWVPEAVVVFVQVYEPC
jgi:hypothetical protein